MHGVPPTYFPAPAVAPLQNNSDVIPFFLAGLCHPAAGVKSLTARTLVALGVRQDAGRHDRCRALLQAPLLPALVAVLGDGDTGAAQVYYSTCNIIVVPVADPIENLCVLHLTVRAEACRWPCF